MEMKKLKVITISKQQVYTTCTITIEIYHIFLLKVQFSKIFRPMFMIFQILHFSGLSLILGCLLPLPQTLLPFYISRQTVCKRRQNWCFPIGFVTSSMPSLNKNLIDCKSAVSIVTQSHRIIFQATRDFNSDPHLILRME